jgi:hypothetical protein
VLRGAARRQRGRLGADPRADREVGDAGAPAGAVSPRTPRPYAQLRASSVRVLTPHVVHALAGDEHRARRGGEGHRAAASWSSWTAPGSSPRSASPPTSALTRWGLRIVDRHVAVDSTMWDRRRRRLRGRRHHRLPRQGPVDLGRLRRGRAGRDQRGRRRRPGRLPLFPGHSTRPPPDPDPERTGHSTDTAARPDPDEDRPLDRGPPGPDLG